MQKVFTFLFFAMQNLHSKTVCEFLLNIHYFLYIYFTCKSACLYVYTLIFFAYIINHIKIPESMCKFTLDILFLFGF